MMKRMIILLIIFIIVEVVGAAEVCVIVDYGKDSDSDPDSKCVNVDEGEDGYQVLEKTAYDILWSPKSSFGHMVCKINDVGTEISGQYCFYDGNFWNFVLVRDGDWLHMPVGLDGPGDCWNNDISSWDGHYCAKNNDYVGFAFGDEGTVPSMFQINVSRVEIDGKKETKITPNGGKLRNAFPGSRLEFKIELENFYDSGTDISINDISIKGTIEEIDDGGDIENDISEFDLEADRKTTKNLEFEIPLEVEERDRLLRIEYDAKDDAGIRYEGKFTYDLEVEKESHEVRILEAKLDRDDYSCGDNGVLDVLLLNTGKSDENIKLEVINEELGVNIKQEFELSDDVYEKSSLYRNKLNIRLPLNVKGSYSLDLILNYAKKREINKIEIIINECEGVSEEKTEVSVAPMQREDEVEQIGVIPEEGQQDVVVARLKFGVLEIFLIGILGIFIIVIALLAFFLIRK